VPPASPKSLLPFSSTLHTTTIKQNLDDLVEDCIKSIKDVLSEVLEREDYEAYRQVEVLNDLFKELQSQTRQRNVVFLYSRSVSQTLEYVFSVLGDGQKIRHIRAHRGNGEDDRTLLHAILLALRFFELIGRRDIGNYWLTRFYDIAYSLEDPVYGHPPRRIDANTSNAANTEQSNRSHVSDQTRSTQPVSDVTDALNVLLLYNCNIRSDYSEMKDTEEKYNRKILSTQEMLLQIRNRGTQFSGFPGFPGLMAFLVT
jgi:hypothetical protein